MIKTLYKNLIKKINGKGGGTWIRDVVMPSRHVIFLNTDPLGYHLEKNNRLGGAKKGGGGGGGGRGDGNTNSKEVQIVGRIIASLVGVNVPLCNVGIISPYRDQVRLLSKDFFLGNLKENQGLEISTVDSYQGR